MTRTKKLYYALSSFIALLLSPVSAFATGMAAGSMPWDLTLMKASEEMSGPLAQGIAVVSVAVTGIMWATGQAEGMVKTMMRVAFGICFIIEAPVVVAYFFVGGVSL